MSFCARSAEFQTSPSEFCNDGGYLQISGAAIKSMFPSIVLNFWNKQLILYWDTDNLTELTVLWISGKLQRINEVRWMMGRHGI